MFFLKNTSVKYLQGGNKLLHKVHGKQKVANYCQGATLPNGLTALARNHKFEPCRGKAEWQAEFTIKSAMFWINRGVPAVLDTHRLNYIEPFADDSLNQLKTVLSALVKVPNIRFLTSPELGEAIANEGRYKDVFTGETVQLTKRDSILKQSLRKWLH